MILAVTPGDPQGIGPEIAWKTIKALHKDPRILGTGVSKKTAPKILCIGARKPFDDLGAKVIEVRPDQLSQIVPPSASARPCVYLLAAPTRAPRGKFLPGYQSGWSIEQAVGLIREGACAAIITGPISKERLNRGGYAYPGHTEFLAELCGLGDRDVTMMLANSQLRVTLVTTHVALKNVSRALKPKEITTTIRRTAGHLKKWWGIKKPRVAVTALNPHAGEGGMFGREEILKITPAIKLAQKALGADAEISGPHPADTLFAAHLDRFDAVVCMYHDQGLIPVKLLDFQKTVNVTLGLPIIRTSVDHGTGFDIAGKNLADPSSMQSALMLAYKIAREVRYV